MALPILLGSVAKSLVSSSDKKKTPDTKIIASNVIEKNKNTKNSTNRKNVVSSNLSLKKVGKTKIKKPKTSNQSLNNTLISFQEGIASVGRTLNNILEQRVKGEKEKRERKRKENLRLKEIGMETIGVGSFLISKIPFIGRIKNFFTQILLGGIVGWLLKNIDEVIRVVTETKEKIEGFFENLNKFLFKPIFEVGKFLVDISWPIIDKIIKSPPVDYAINEIKEKISELDNFISDIGKVLIDKGFQIETQNQSLSSDGIGKSTFELIASGEGDYNSVNRGNAGDTPGGAKSIFGKDLTEMTVDEIITAQSQGDVYAVGKYQLIPTTLREFANSGQINLSDKFDENTQEKFKSYVINVKRPEVGRYLRGESDDVVSAAQGLAREFASVGAARPETIPGFSPAQRGDTLYGGRGNNKASISPDKIISSLKRDRQISPPSAMPMMKSTKSKLQSELPALPPTGTGSYAAAQQYGAPRDRGKRRHAGQDFDAGPNGTFYSRIGGEVIYSGNAGGGYGNVVDVYNKELGYTERVAEGDSNLVRKGQIIAPGTPLQRGTRKTGVFHYEIRRGKATDSSSFEGTVNPLIFLKNLDRMVRQRQEREQSKPPSEQAQSIQSTSSQSSAQKVSRSASYDKTRTVAIAMDTGGGSGGGVLMGGGRGLSFGGQSALTTANTYYRASVIRDQYST